MKRRESLKLMAIASLAAALPGCSKSDVERAAGRVASASRTLPLKDREPTTLNRHEYATVTLLADMIIPADDRSGSASEAGVPAFIDFIVEDTIGLETRVRGGLSWLDYESSRRFSSTFLDASSDEQTQLIDDIAWPERTSPGLESGSAFFSLFRDLTASGFWSSQMGVEDLGYSGNTPRPSWDGCPIDAMDHLGLSYPET